MKRNLVALCLGLAALGVVALDSRLEAGSVFMKNGYIIQGSIVDRDPDSIILGWPNGKMAIARRFVDSVVFEPAEEQQLVELDRARNELQARSTDLALVEMAGGNEVRELPATLEVFIRKYNLGPTLDSSGAVEQPVEPVDPVVSVTVIEPVLQNDPVSVSGETPVEIATIEPVVTTVDPVVDPGADDLFHDETRDVGLPIPDGWVPLISDRALEVTGRVEANGFRPSMNVVIVPAGSLLPSEYADFLETEYARLLQDHEILEKGTRDIGGQEAFVFIVRGLRDGREAVIQQYLVAQAERLYLLSGFSSDREPLGAFGRIEASLQAARLGEN